MRKKPVVCYDEGCLDGVTAAWLMFRLYPGAIFVPLAHPVSDEQWHKLLKEASAEKELIVADYAPPPEKILKLGSLYRQITVCDHHFTEIIKYPRSISSQGIVLSSGPAWKNVVLHFDVEKCGAEIVYEKVFLPRLHAAGNRDLADLAERPDIISYVRMADLGLTSEPDYGPIVSFVDDYILSANSELYNAFFSLDCLKGIPREKIIAAGERSYAKYQEQAEIVLRDPDYTPIIFPDGRASWVPIIAADIRGPGGRFIADMACELSKQNERGIFFIYCSRKGVVNLSVRTSGTPHAGEIAKLLGAYGFSGGGHEKRGCAQFPEKKILNSSGGLLVPSFRDLFPVFGAGKKVAKHPASDYAKINLGVEQRFEADDIPMFESITVQRTAAGPGSVYPRSLVCPRP